MRRYIKFTYNYYHYYSIRMKNRNPRIIFVPPAVHTYGHKLVQCNARRHCTVYRPIPKDIKLYNETERVFAQTIGTKCDVIGSPIYLRCDVIGSPIYLRSTHPTRVRARAINHSLLGMLERKSK